MTLLSFGDLIFLFRTKNEDRWMFARQWLWRSVFKPIFVSAGVLALAYSVGFSLSKGISAGLDVTFKLQLQAGE